MRNPGNFGENSNFFCIQKVLSQQMTLFYRRMGMWVKDRLDVNWHEYLMTILSTSVHLLILIVVIQIISTLIRASCLSKISWTLQEAHKALRIFMQDSPDHSFTFDEVTSSMVSVIIESFKTWKSPGFDNINALVVKLTSKVIVPPLTELSHACIRKGAVPMARGSLPRLHQF